MSVISRDELPAVRAMARLTYCNPFLAERVDLERQVLGDVFVAGDVVWHPRGNPADANPNLNALGERARSLAEAIRTRLLAGEQPTPAECALYQDLAIYVLYDGCRDAFVDLLDREARGDGTPRVPAYGAFESELQRLLIAPGVGLPHGQVAERLFACFFQVRRAFQHTFLWIAGGSLPAARLRAQVWQSIFTHDLKRYQRSLYARMGDMTTLITGPSGAGKELVARAVALSRYVPFDAASRTFAARTDTSLFALNLSALSPTLIESELFGHRRGAFTGAVADRQGWLEVCPPTGAVFLDEIGEIDAGIQVKLLRVLESRRFQPLGSSDDLRFEGKIIAATNRDLGVEMREGRFREDLYYRLCADTVVAPSLRERLRDSPDELETLVLFLAERLVGESEAPTLTREAVNWIDENLGPEYAWPGNVRELSHCVSNVMIHRDYRPASLPSPSAPREALAAEFISGQLPAGEILRRYCTLVYAETGSYVRAAERLGVDRRTVKDRVDAALLARLRGA